MSRFCTQCAQQADRSDQFCSRCGKPLKTLPSSQPSSSDTWEYREFNLDFWQVLIPRSSIPPNASIAYDAQRPHVSLAQLQWEYSADKQSDWSLENLHYRFCKDIWWYREPRLTKEVNALAAQG